MEDQVSSASSRPILYNTSACHLCEEALQLVEPVCIHLGKPLLLLEICGNEYLEQRYGIRIPVLALGDRELDWPFTLEQVSQFLTS